MQERLLKYTDSLKSQIVHVVVDNSADGFLQVPHKLAEFQSQFHQLKQSITRYHSQVHSVASMLTASYDQISQQKQALQQIKNERKFLQD